MDVAALFAQAKVDIAALASHIRQSLQSRTQISLAELLQLRPLQQCLAELVAYLQLASKAGQAVVDEDTQDTVQWTVAGVDHGGTRRSAQILRVIFVRA